MSKNYFVHMTNRQVVELNTAEYCRVINEIKNSQEMGLSEVILKTRCGCNFLLWNFRSYGADSCPILYHGPKLLVPAKDKRQGQMNPWWSNQVWPTMAFPCCHVHIGCGIPKYVVAFAGFGCVQTDFFGRFRVCPGVGLSSTDQGEKFGSQYA